MRTKETYKSCSLKKTLKTANAASLTNVKSDLTPTVPTIPNATCAIPVAFLWCQNQYILQTILY